jgi:hypothetical protein
MHKTEFMSLMEELDKITESPINPDDANIVDYVEYKHSYCHFLEPQLKKLNYYCNVLKKPANYIKAIIRNILKNPECRITEKEQSFLREMSQHVDSGELYRYVKNSIAKAHKTLVYVDENGELIPELNDNYVDFAIAESLNESQQSIEETLVELFMSYLQGWSWEEWQAAGSSDREEIVVNALAELGANMDTEEAYDIFYDWAAGLTEEDF